MAMTMTQKILAAHAGLDHVVPGQLIRANLDMVLGNDITTPVAVNEFEKAGFDGVFDREKISLVMDHFTPNKDIKAAEQCMQCRTFAKRFDVKNFFDVGRMGIEHALLPEQGIVKAGDCIIGADSHTCTYGALGAFSTGVGSTDMAAGMATGQAWFKVPEAIKFNLTGKLNENVTGKDVILHIIGMIGVDGALYKSMEFMGEGLKSLSMEDRLCISNMAIEAGAKNGIFMVDEITENYLTGRAQGEWKVFAPDEDAEYVATYDINLSELKPTVSFPHLPENTKTIDEVGDVPIQQVVIGSCTNGRLEVLQKAAAVLKGKKVAPFVKLIVTPASRKIYRQALADGTLEILSDAGAIITHPGCGLCCGRTGGILSDGERVVATNNRNFLGRMGTSKVEIFLASPVTAAACAVVGEIVEG